MSTLLATTKMSSRGQIVIPEEIREQLGLLPGVQFLVLCGEQNDLLMLKRITPPSKQEFKKIIGEFLGEARTWAKEVGLSEKDISEAIKEVRGNNKKN